MQNNFKQKISNMLSNLNWVHAIRTLAKHKTRTLLGISGINIGAALLLIIGMLGDSMSYAYMDQASAGAGKIDFVIYGGELNSTALEGQIKADSELGGLIADFLPRSGATTWGNYSRTIQNLNTSEQQSVHHVGVDIARENVANHGSFLNLDGTPFTGAITDDECLIFEPLAEKLEVEAGDTVLFNYSTFTSGDRVNLLYNQTKNYTVKAVVNSNLKFPVSLEYVLLVNLNEWNDFYSVTQGMCYTFVLNFKNPEAYYTIKNIPGTIEKVRNVGEDIINVIGFFNTYDTTNSSKPVLYWVSIPRIEILEIQQYVSIGFSIVLLLVSFWTMIIAAILINGILTTSIEEKIREFGIFRVLGSHKLFTIKFTTIQTLVMSAIGSAIGITAGYFIASGIIIPWISGFLDSFLPFSVGNSTAILTPETLTFTLIVCFLYPIIIGIFPALKVNKKGILASINPYKKQQVGQKMVKEGNINGKYVLIGLLFTANSAFVLYIVPQILLTLDIGLIIAVIVILLSIFLLGATLIGIGFVPVIQKLFTYLFTMLSRKTRDIIKIALVRYERRNLSTVLMFSISFAFITVISSILGTQSRQAVDEVFNDNGSDLLIDSSGSIISGYNPASGLFVPNETFSKDLMQIDGIERVSTILATTTELDVLQGSSYSLTISDRVKYKSNDVHAVAVDQYYLNTVYTKYCVLSSGSLEGAFEQLLDGSNSIIISKALALTLQFNLNDRVVLSFQWGESSEVVEEEFHVVGIADNLPGIPSVEKSVTSGIMGGDMMGGGLFGDDEGEEDEDDILDFSISTGGDAPGILLDQEIFKHYFQLSPGDCWTSKIFIKLKNQYRDTSSSLVIEEQILDLYEDSHVFKLRNSFTEGEFESQLYKSIETIFIVILSLAVITSLFGLASAAYSTILERTREVGIIETLGLYKRKVATMFVIEGEIILMSASVIGAIVGITLSALFYGQIDAFSSYPIFISFEIPWNTLIIEIVIAVITCGVTLKFLVKRIQKMELMEIFRLTL
ncbi:MAG: ABC transporter permease [Candidatus Hodarchaeota archaeon]